MDSLNFQKKIREPAFAGQFYPGTKKELDSELKELFHEAKDATVISEQLRAVISPHAGYMFSGQVAASAFNQIPAGATYKRIFVLASSHRFRFNGAAVFTAGNYSTPLGEIKVDTKLAKKLLKSSEVFLNKPEAHENEHSLEVQLPFLQRRLGNDFVLVPIILGTNNPSESKIIAQHLQPYFTAENLFVVSTDFSHYPSFDDARMIDSATADAICTNQPDNLLDTLEKNKSRDVSNLATSLCGWTSVLTLLYITTNNHFEYKKIDYRNSGHARTYGDKHKVVGYWAIAITEKKVDKPFQVSKKEQTELLRMAREAIKSSFSNQKKPVIQSMADGGILDQSAGAFVSIYVNGNLRGCIGSFAQPEKSLKEVVQKSAVSATNDIRFQPLDETELDNMELEISVLSPMKEISSIEEIELGRHGIYIKKGIHSGTFLPQVAKKTGWTREEFLGHCSRNKAGIGWDGWKNAEVYTYEAFVFKG